MKILISKNILDNKQFLDKFRDRVDARLRKDPSAKYGSMKIEGIEFFINSVESLVPGRGPDILNIYPTVNKAQDTIGSYMMWIISRYANGAIRLFEDVRQVVDDLLYFD